MRPKGMQMGTKISGAVLWCALCLALLAGGCEEDQTAASQGEGVVSGIVVDGSTYSALSDVTITGRSLEAGDQSAMSDASGNFRLSFALDSTGSATVLLQKAGYRDTTFVVNLRAGTVVVVSVALTPKSAVVGPGGTGTGGTAQTIAFLQATPAEVSVYGVGGTETSLLTWEVRDSLGIPIDALHTAKLTFTSANGPNGGEFISPPAVETNASGQAFTTFNAGTKSGVVQITASTTVGTRTITSSPIRLVIHGGFPVQSHFSIAPAAHNFPAMGILGKSLSITVLVGDMYSNPVVPNTAVYFHSSAGVIQPSIFTSGDGFGTVQLYSGNPDPMGSNSASAFGNGYHYVVARTLGQGGITVRDSTLILWSGRGIIDNVTPTTFDIPNAGSQIFSFRLADALGHPLAAGTKILVKATIPPPATDGEKQNQVVVAFGVNGELELPDLLFAGAGSTDFTFSMKDGTWSVTDATPVTLTIAVTGPNTIGGVSYTFTGIVR
jgi:hypothetical protein